MTSNDSQTPLLSEMVESPLNRRFFLRRASLAGAAIAAASCSPAGTGDGTATGDSQEPSPGTFNSSSRADTTLDLDHTSSHTPAVADASVIGYQRYDPRLPPLSEERTLQLHWRATEVPIRINNDTVIAAWTFEDNVPGPIVHVREGDTIEFTLTNTGSRGALFDTPIVFLPQSAILGTGIVSKKPVVVSDNGLDAIAIRSTVYLALSYDHRIVDGADAARFLVAVKNRLESGDFSGDLGI